MVIFNFDFFFLFKLFICGGLSVIVARKSGDCSFVRFRLSREVLAECVNPASMLAPVPVARYGLINDHDLLVVLDTSSKCRFRIVLTTEKFGVNNFVRELNTYQWCELLFSRWCTYTF